jgi:hypothetical protein
MKTRFNFINNNYYYFKRIITVRIQSVQFKSRVNYESQLFFSLTFLETFVAKVQIIKLSIIFIYE